MEKANVPVQKEIVTELEQIFRIVDDKPYFELRYKKVGEDYYHVGYSSFDFHNVLKWKEEWQKEYLKEAWACDLGAKSSDKQIPMKPNNIKSILDFSGRYYTTKGNCPVCNREGLYKSDFYCNKCGQKLDWGEENDR